MPLLRAATYGHRPGLWRQWEHSQQGRHYRERRRPPWTSSPSSPTIGTANSSRTPRHSAPPSACSRWPEPPAAPSAPNDACAAPPATPGGCAPSSRPRPAPTSDRPPTTPGHERPPGGHHEPHPPIPRPIRRLAGTLAALATALLAAATSSGRLPGQTLATLVSFFNLSLVLLGGKVAGAGDLLLAAVREGIYHRSLSVVTRDLRISLSTLRPDPGLYGAAFMVLDELFSRRHLGRWLHHGTPAGHTEISGAAAS